MSGVDKRSRSPTLRDVAELSGSSTAVVSYVVNDGPRAVAPETKRRVQAAIDELGYRPNRAARALATSRSRTLGLVVPDTTNAFFSDLVRAVERRARDEGLITFVGNSDYDSVRERGYVEAFEDYGADGIIVVCADLGRPWKAAVSTPLVFVHRRPRGASGPVVRADDRRGAELATEHLLRLGRGPVHCVAGPEDSGPIEERVQAWRNVQSGARGDAAATADLVRVGYPRATAAAELGPWLAALSFPTAVFVTTDEQAIGLLSAAATAGVRVPDDLAVVAYDDTTAAAHCVPPLTTVRADLDEMAARAVAQILRHGEGEEAFRGDDTYQGDVQLVIRGSCAGKDRGRPMRIGP
jgi:LacI family transcriptional regulator, galactose operon repressor